MPLIRHASLGLAVTIAMLVWFGPLPSMTNHSFAVHMAMHMALVAIIAPLIAIAVAGTSVDPVLATPRLMAPVPMSLIELAIVWAWHVPALHQSARERPDVFVLEQASFLIAGTLLWVAVIGGDHEQRRVRAGPGVAALLFTSMHMTLLGALFALAGRPLFRHGGPYTAAAIADQQLGGVIMLLVGGAVYLVGGLWLTAVALRPALRRAAPIKERSA